MEEITQEQPIRIDEAVAYTGLSKWTIYQKSRKAEIPHYKKDNILYFLKSELRRWMLECKVECRTI